MRVAPTTNSNSSGTASRISHLWNMRAWNTNIVYSVSGRLQFVADSMDSLDQGSLRALVYLLSQPHNVDTNRIRCHIRLGGPYSLQQCLRAEDPVRIAHKKLEQRKFSLLKLNLRAIPGYSIVGRVKNKITNGQDVGRSTRCPAQQCSHPGRKFFHVKWLRQIVVGTGVQAGLLIRNSRLS